MRRAKYLMGIDLVKRNVYFVFDDLPMENEADGVRGEWSEMT